jgi:anti-sigma B factor antagonist
VSLQILVTKPTDRSIMAPIALRASEAIARDKPNWRIVPWEGEVDIAVAPAMLARVLDGSYDDYIVVDLGAVAFMDGSGLGALIEARTLLKAAGGELLVRNPSEMVRWMLGHFKLTDMLEPDLVLP